MDPGEGDGGLELSIVLGEGLEAPDGCGETERMPQRPESLFKVDCAMEVCIRSSRKIVGVRDRYYYDLKSHHHFRSKKDVDQYFILLTGMIRRYTTPKSKKSATNKPSELRFDFKNHPTKVNWVLTNISPEGMRTSCKEGYCQSRHGIHGWPQWKTSTVACMNFSSSDGGEAKTQILK